MLAHMPVTTLSGLGEINNINLNQLNSVFENIYVNDQYFKELYDKVPKVYENGRRYEEDDAVWLNTEYYLEFIDFPDHARHIVSDYNEIASTYGKTLTTWFESGEHEISSIAYMEDENKITVYSSNDGLEPERRQINYKNEEQLCKDLIKYSYVIGDLSASAVLYRCKSETGTTAVSYDVENDGEVVFKAAPEPANWAGVYVNNTNINYAYLSALVRTILSVHAMTYYPTSEVVPSPDPEDKTIHYRHERLLSSEISTLTFNGQPINQIYAGYTPDYGCDELSNNYTITIAGKYAWESLLSNNMYAKTPTEDDDCVSSRINQFDGGFSYFYQDENGKYKRKRFTVTDNRIQNPENIWFIHGEREKQSIDMLNSIYTDVETMNIHLSSIYECVNNDPLSVELRHTSELSNRFNYIIYSNNVKDARIDIWTDGMIEYTGSAIPPISYLTDIMSGLKCKGFDSNYYTAPVPESIDTVINLSSYLDSKISFRAAYYAPLSETVPLLSTLGVVSAKQYVDYCNNLIFKKLIQFSAQSKSEVFDGLEHSIEVTVTDPTEGYTILYSTSEDGDYTMINPGYINPGEYTTWFKIEASDYETVKSSAEVVITQDETSS